MCCSDIDFKSIFTAANYLNRKEKNFELFAVTATANATISMYCKLNVHHLQQALQFTKASPAHMYDIFVRSALAKKQFIDR